MTRSATPLNREMATVTNSDIPPEVLHAEPEVSLAPPPLPPVQPVKPDGYPPGKEDSLEPA